MQKRCYHCKNMDICVIWNEFNRMASFFNHMIDEQKKPEGNETGFTVMVNHMAKNCNRYEDIPGE